MATQHHRHKHVLDFEPSSRDCSVVFLQWSKLTQLPQGKPPSKTVFFWRWLSFPHVRVEWKARQWEEAVWGSENPTETDDLMGSGTLPLKVALWNSSIRTKRMILVQPCRIIHLTQSSWIRISGTQVWDLVFLTRFYTTEYENHCFKSYRSDVTLNFFEFSIGKHSDFLSPEDPANLFNWRVHIILNYTLFW